MSFHTEGAEGVGMPGSIRLEDPAPEGRNAAARAAYLSMVHEVFVLSAGSTEGAAVTASVSTSVDPAVRADPAGIAPSVGVSSLSRRSAPALNDEGSGE